jgi:hypothetical protein
MIFDILCRLNGIIIIIIIIIIISSSLHDHHVHLVISVLIRLICI